VAATRLRVPARAQRLRVGELCAANIDDLGESTWHHTLTLRAETTKAAVIALATRTVQAITPRPLRVALRSATAQPARTAHDQLQRDDPSSPGGTGDRRARPFVYTEGYTLGMSKTVPVREFRTHLAELLAEVADRREHVTVTRRGRPAAVLVPVDEYEALEETAEILSDEDTLAAIRRGLDDLAAGDEVPLEQVRDEHADRNR
jgi:antitoxin YefM